MSLYALNIPAGSTGAFHDALSPPFTSFLPGIPLFLSFDLAVTRVTGTNTGTLHVELRWYDASGNALTPFTQDIIINGTAEALQRYTIIPPATAASGHCYLKLTPAVSPTQHDVWIKKLRLGKTELSATLGADWGSNLASRPANLSALAGSEGINNAGVSIGSNGALVGGGGGQVTLPGIAPNVDPSASMADNILRNARFLNDTSYWTLGGASARAAGTSTAPPRVIASVNNDSIVSETRPIPPGARKLYLSLDQKRSNAGTPISHNFFFYDAANGFLSAVTINDNGSNVSNLTHLQSGTPVQQVAGSWETAILAVDVPIAAVLVQLEPVFVLSAGQTVETTNYRLSTTFPASDITSLNNVVISSDFGAGASDNLVKNALFQQLDAAGNPAMWSLGAGASIQASSNTSDPPKFLRLTTSAGAATPNASTANAATGLYGSGSGIMPWPGGPKKLYVSGLARTDASNTPGLVSVYLYRGGAFVAAPGAYLAPSAPNTWQEKSFSLDLSAYAFDAYQIFISLVGVYQFDLADLRVAFTERAATLGADWSGNVTSRPGNLSALAGSEGIQNGLMSIGNNGALLGGGGGQVTIGGLGFAGDLDAQRNSRIGVIGGRITGIGSGSGAYVDNTLVPVGQNVLVNSDFSMTGNKLFGWTPAWQGNVPNTTNYDLGVNFPGISGQLNVAWARIICSSQQVGGGYVFDGHQSNPTTELPRSVLELQQYALAVYDGDTVFASCLLGVHRCQGAVFIQWFDGAGYVTNQAGSSLPANCDAQGPYGGRQFGGGNGDPANFDRMTLFAIAPANARYAILRVRGGNIAQSSTDFSSYMFYTQMMLCKVAAGQVTPPPYTPGILNSVPVLAVAGSGARLGDGRNMPSVFSAGGRYYFNQAPTYTASPGTPPTATISIPAGTLQVGGTPVNYNAMSVNVTGTASTQVTYYLYIDDLGFAGGTLTLVASTSPTDPYLSDARIYLGQITVGFPSIATGQVSGSGTSGGGGSYSCVWENAWVHTLRGYVRAKDVRIGDYLVVLDYETMNGVRFERVTANKVASRRGWEIVTGDREARLYLSEETPLTLKDGSAIYPCQLTGQELPTIIDGEFAWKPCFAQPLGQDINVCLISCGSQTYAAGLTKGRMILTHNVTQVYSKP